MCWKPLAWGASTTCSPGFEEACSVLVRTTIEREPNNSAWNKFVPGGVFTLQTWLKQVFQTTLSLLILFLFSVALIWEKRAWKLLRCIITSDGKAMRGTKRSLLPDITVLRELSSGPGYLLQDIHSKHGPYFSEFLMCLHIKSKQWWPPWWSVSVWFVFFRRALGIWTTALWSFHPSLQLPLCTFAMW